jgi:hypothetical protein
MTKAGTKSFPGNCMFTHILPGFRRLGVTAEEDWMMRRNPRRIIPVQ